MGKLYKLIVSIKCVFHKKLEFFGTVIHFQTSLILEGKAGVEPLTGLYNKGRLLGSPANIRPWPNGIKLFMSVIYECY